MLLHLHIKNLALIRETQIDFTEGLNILTGETGAGKSIIIGSIATALGGKVPREMLRSEEEPALIELVFSLDSPALRERMGELELPLEDDQVILSRRINGSRSLCRVNGETVSASVMKELASYLIDLHGQHEHQSLLNKKKHLEILDEYGREELAPVREELSSGYRRCQKQKKELQELSMDASARLREQSLLEYELQELQEAGLQEGEDERLEQDYRRMGNARTLLEALGDVRSLCTEGDCSAGDNIGRACRELSQAARLDESLEGLEGQLADLESMLQDFGRELDAFMESLEFSSEDFSRTQERLDQINHLKSKYGQTLEAVRAAQEEREQRLELLLHYEQRLASLQESYDRERELLEEKCRQLHALRAKKARSLAALMKEQLAELNFLDVQFDIRVEETLEPTAAGWDDVEFLISVNPGEPLKPLGRIASGGELSRVMLAIKTVLADQDAIGTVIFDEIDAGISGRTAQRVSEKLALIGRSRQVICITHLAQLAAMADSHYCIEKKAREGSTITGIRRLGEEETVEELARLLGGARITEAVRENALEMKRLAAQLKTGNI